MAKKGDAIVKVLYASTALGGLMALMFAVLVVMRFTVFDFYHVPSESMAPAIPFGTHFLTWRNAGELKPGQIVMHRTEGQVYAKRVVAVAGQTVEIKGQTVWIDGIAATYADRGQEEVCTSQDTMEFAQRKTETLPSGVSYDILVGTGGTMDGAPYTVKEGEIYVLGDFRTNSMDSRVMGAVRTSDVIGVYWRTLFSACY